MRTRESTSGEGDVGYLSFGIFREWENTLFVSRGLNRGELFPEDPALVGFR